MVLRVEKLGRRLRERVSRGSGQGRAALAQALRGARSGPGAGGADFFNKNPWGYAAPLAMKIGFEVTLTLRAA